MRSYLLIFVAIWPMVVMGQPSLPSDTKRPIRVFLKHDRPIGGYEVTALWQPFEAKNCETGCITVTFRNRTTGIEFEYVNNEKFNSYHTDLITFSEGFEGYKDGDEYTIKYNSPDTPKLPHKPIDYYLPFQFYDVDFDGKDELLVRDWGGSRNGDCSVYEITNKGLKEKSYFPFGQIDAQTEFDSDQKIIKLCVEDGAWLYYKVICKKHPQKELHQLIVPTDIDPTLHEILADITARTTASDFHIVSASVQLGEKEYELFVACDRWNLKCSKSHIK